MIYLGRRLIFIEASILEKFKRAWAQCIRFRLHT
jgi:hypothetical protein